MSELSPDRLREIETRCDCRCHADGAGFCDGCECDHVKHYWEQRLESALKQAREERYGYAAALQNARDAFSDQAKEETWAEVGNPGLTKLLRSRAKEFLMATADPAECLKARDAEVATRAIEIFTEEMQKKADSAGGKQ